MAQQLINASNPLNNNTGTVRLGGNIASSDLNNLNLGSNPANQENLPFGFAETGGISAVDDIQKPTDIYTGNQTNAQALHKWPISVTIVTLENKTTGADVVEQLLDGRFWSNTTKTFVARSSINTVSITTNAEAANLSTMLNGKLIITGS